MRRFNWVIMSVIAIFLLSGCSSPQKRAAMPDDRQQKARVAATLMRTAVENKCLGYGFEKGTTAFASCVMQIDLLTQRIVSERNRQSEMESRCSIARAQGYIAPTASGNFGESLANANDAYANCMAGLPPSRPVNVICQRQERDRVYCFTN